jgi:hypothetical protein
MTAAWHVDTPRRRGVIILQRAHAMNAWTVVDAIRLRDAVQYSASIQGDQKQYGLLRAPGRSARISVGTTFQ